MSNKFISTRAAVQKQPKVCKSKHPRTLPAAEPPFPTLQIAGVWIGSDSEGEPITIIIIKEAKQLTESTWRTVFIDNLGRKNTIDLAVQIPPGLADFSWTIERGTKIVAAAQSLVEKMVSTDPIDTGTINLKPSTGLGAPWCRGQA